MPLNLPPEAYRSTPRLRAWMKLADADPTVTWYGLAGAAYAKTRKLKQTADEAKAWQDTHTGAPAQGGVVPVGSKPI